MDRAAGKTIVIAPGNRFRGDDGAGPLVADRLKVRGRHVTVADGPMDALRILSLWEDAPLAVVIDAAYSGARPGTVQRIECGAGGLPKDLARCSSHGIGIAEAIDLGRVLGRMPGRLVMYVIEAKSLAFGAALSPEVESVLGDVARRVEDELAADDRAERVSDARSLPRP
jgi:hydrogenase maturation protease